MSSPSSDQCLIQDRARTLPARLYRRAVSRGVEYGEEFPKDWAERFSLGRPRGRNGVDTVGWALGFNQRTRRCARRRAEAPSIRVTGTMPRLLLVTNASRTSQRGFAGSPARGSAAVLVSAMLTVPGSSSPSPSAVAPKAVRHADEDVASGRLQEVALRVDEQGRCRTPPAPPAGRSGMRRIERSSSQVGLALPDRPRTGSRRTDDGGGLRARHSSRPVPPPPHGPLTLSRMITSCEVGERTCSADLLGVRQPPWWTGCPATRPCSEPIKVERPGARVPPIVRVTPCPAAEEEALARWDRCGTDRSARSGCRLQSRTTTRANSWMTCARSSGAGSCPAEMGAASSSSLFPDRLTADCRVDGVLFRHFQRNFWRRRAAFIGLLAVRVAVCLVLGPLARGGRPDAGRLPGATVAVRSNQRPRRCGDVGPTPRFRAAASRLARRGVAEAWARSAPLGERLAGRRPRPSGTGLVPTVGIFDDRP